MKKSEADAFISETVKSDGEKEIKHCYPFCMENDGKVFSIEDAARFPIVAMWACAFKTSIVKSSHVDLPEHSLYTDTIYLTNTIANISTLEYFGDPIYYYRVGREGQSNNIASIEKHYREAINVCEIVFNNYEALPKEKKTEYLLKRVNAIYNSNIQMICKMHHSIRNFRLLIDYDKSTKEKHKEISSYNKAKRLKVLRATLYLAYWVNFPE